MRISDWSSDVCSSDLEQVPFLDIGGDEEVQRRGLIDLGRAVGGEFEQPALVDLEAGLVAVLLVLRQEVEVLDAAAAFEDRVPDRVAVLRLVDEQRLEVRVADRVAARERLVRVDEIGRTAGRERGCK